MKEVGFEQRKAQEGRQPATSLGSTGASSVKKASFLFYVSLLSFTWLRCSTLESQMRELKLKNLIAKRTDISVQIQVLGFEHTASDAVT